MTVPIIRLMPGIGREIAHKLDIRSVRVKRFRASGSGLIVSRFFSLNCGKNINAKEKKREAVNPESGIRNLLTRTDQMSNLWAVPRSIRGLRSFLFKIYKVELIAGYRFLLISRRFR